MKIQFFCLSLLFITTGLLPAAEQQDFAKFRDLDDNELGITASHLPNADLSRFQQVSKRFRAIGQAEFEKRPRYLWKEGTVTQKIFHAHQGVVASVFAMNNGNIVSVGKEDRSINFWLWKGNSYTNIKSIFDNIGGYAGAAAFSPAHDRLVSYHSNGMIFVWDIETGRELKQFYGGNRVNFELSPDDTTLATSRERTIDLWNVLSGTRTEQITAAMSGHTHHVCSLAFSPDGKSLASSENLSKSIKVWNIKSLTTEKEYTLEEEEWVLANLFFTSDGRLIAYQPFFSAASQKARFLIRDLQTAHKVTQLQSDFTMKPELAWTPDGTVLAAGAIGGTLKTVIWQVQPGKVLQDFDIEGPINSIAFSPDGKILVAGCDNGDIIVWKTAPKKPAAKNAK